MLLDENKKFIFVKTKKTASTSLEIALSSACGNDAVVTPIKEEDERIRFGLGISGARNFRFGENDVTRNLDRVPKFVKQGFYNHISAWDIKRLLKEEYDSYFKVSVVRNPWDRFVSHYYWAIRDKGTNTPSFRQFMRQSPENVNCNERLLFHPAKDKLLVDFVVRYEHFKEDLDELTSFLNLDADIYALMNKASAKTNVRPKNNDKYGLYCDFTSKLVEMLCEKEIDEFGYKRPF